MTIKHSLFALRRNIHYWCALSIVSAFLCLPVLTVTYAPLVDYPNHLARVHILYKYAEAPAYQAAYFRVLEPRPNMAIELLVFPLLPFVDILAASKIFLILTVLLFITGCHQLGTAIHGRPTWLVLPSLFFVYNSMLFYGFVNYIVGVSVFCLALAFRLRLRVKWTLRRFLMLTFTRISGLHGAPLRLLLYRCDNGCRDGVGLFHGEGEAAHCGAQLDTAAVAPHLFRGVHEWWRYDRTHSMEYSYWKDHRHSVASTHL